MILESFSRLSLKNEVRGELNAPGGIMLAHARCYGWVKFTTVFHKENSTLIVGEKANLPEQSHSAFQPTAEGEVAVTFIGQYDLCVRRGAFSSRIVSGCVEMYLPKLAIALYSWTPEGRLCISPR